MSRYSQMKPLIKQEVKRALRSKYIVIGFVLMPLLIWGIQGAFQAVIFNTIEDRFAYEGNSFYVANLDDGNTTYNLGNILEYQFERQLSNPDAEIYGAKVIEMNLTGLTEDQIFTKVKQEDISPLVIIPENFTQVYTQFNSSWSTPPSFVTIVALPSDYDFANAILRTYDDVCNEEPFTEFTQYKLSYSVYYSVTYEGEEGASNPFSSGFLGLLAIMLAVMAPAGFVSSSFAGEREKHTLESLLVLPMRRFDILLSKLIAGMMLVGIFAVMNGFGMKLYEMLVVSIEIDGQRIFNPIPFTTLLLVTGMMYISTFAAIGIGISIASMTRDSRTSETTYTFIMLFPAMLVGMMVFISGLPIGLNWLYILPWTHSLAILLKLLYPQTYGANLITGSIGLDILFHSLYLVVFVIVTLYIASKIFDRENILV